MASKNVKKHFFHSNKVSKREMANVSGGRLSKQAINAVFTVNDANGDGYLDQVCQGNSNIKIFLGGNCASLLFLSEFTIVIFLLISAAGSR